MTDFKVGDLVIFSFGRRTTVGSITAVIFMDSMANLTRYYLGSITYICKIIDRQLYSEHVYICVLYEISGYRMIECVNCGLWIEKSQLTPLTIENL